MATATTNTVLDHSSDAGFRSWVAEFIALLTTGGALVQTADTGQIDTATVARPAINTNAGYAVFRFDDALQATAPYFFRFDFGTDSTATHLRLQLTIGTGSNGAGAITGIIHGPAQVGSQGAPASTSTPYLSRACGHAGTISIAFKLNAVASSGYQYIGLHRARDAAGAQTADGLHLIWGHRSSGAVASLSGLSHRRVSPATFGGPANNGVCLVPLFTTTSSPPSGPTRSYRHFGALPDPRPLLESLTVVATECVAGTEFVARPVGATDRNYVSLGTAIRSCAAGASATDVTYALAMLWD